MSYLATSATIRQRWPAVASACLALSGCMNLSGLDGGTHYACKAPDGVACDSVSGTYANATQGNLPGQRAKRPGAAGQAERPSPAARRAPRPAAPSESQAAPLRSSARILRLWVKPWEDADLDLHDQSYVYVQVDTGQWLIDRAQRQIRDAYAPLRPPVQRAPKAPTGPTGGEAPPPRSEPALAPSADTDNLLPPLDAPNPSAQ